jgi:hypothetical protein
LRHVAAHVRATDDLQSRPAAPYLALRRSLDEELRNQDALAFRDVSRARRWDAGVSDASDDELRPDPLQALKRDENHTVLRQDRLIPADVGAQKSVCHAACRPMSGLRLPVLCK